MLYTSAPPAVAPHGAFKSLFGTNPICFGTPTGSKIPFILDTSISMINRENFRHNSYISQVANGSICGFGAIGYEIAVNCIIKLIDLDYH